MGQAKATDGLPPLKPPVSIELVKVAVQISFSACVLLRHGYKRNDLRADHR
jgi:hypothetical protein